VIEHFVKAPMEGFGHCPGWSIGRKVVTFTNTTGITWQPLRILWRFVHMQSHCWPRIRLKVNCMQYEAPALARSSPLKSIPICPSIFAFIARFGSS
jgi:hypothetical protein